MKIQLVWIGKPKHQFSKEAIDLYLKRLKHYIKISVVEIKDVKVKTADLQKEMEAQLFQKHISSGAYVICLDERGKEFTSMQLSKKISNLQNNALKEVNIVIGGAYGFHSSILEKADEKWALSKFTLPHDLCRIILTEQIYRAFTILKNEKYHNP